jgi:hypothetical protein
VTFLSSIARRADVHDSLALNATLAGGSAFSWWIKTASVAANGIGKSARGRFPDQLACLEYIVGDREIPDHPLVKQTIDDCSPKQWTSMDWLKYCAESSAKRSLNRSRFARPSPMASEILNARPYAFLDNAPLEERRTQAVYTRRASESGSRRSSDGLGLLDAAAIEKVEKEAWPEATNADELHDALMLLVVMTHDEAQRTSDGESSASLRLAPPVERKRDARATFECNDAVTGHLLEELVASIEQRNFRLAINFSHCGGTASDASGDLSERSL